MVEFASQPLIHTRHALRLVAGRAWALRLGGHLLWSVFAVAGVWLVAGLVWIYAPAWEPLRWTLRIGAWLSLAYPLWVLVRQRRGLGLLAIARQVDVHQPETAELFSTALQCAREDDSTATGSPWLKQRVLAQAEAAYQEIEPARVVSLRPVAWALLGMALMALVWVGAGWTVGPKLFSGIKQVFYPQALGSVEVVFVATMDGKTPATGWAVVEGSAPQILVRVRRAGKDTFLDADTLGTMEAHLETNTGETSSQRLDILERSEGTYLLRLSSLKQDVYFTVVTEGREGRYESGRYSLEILPLPRVLAAQSKLEFPAYTQWLAQDFQATDGSVKALVGSDVTLQFQTNQPILSRSRIVFTHADGHASALPLSVQAEGWNSVRWTLRDQVRYQVELYSSEERRNLQAWQGRIEAVPDLAPVATIVQPAGTLRVRPTALIPLQLEAHDDIGLVGAELRLQAEAWQRVIPLDLPAATAQWQVPYALDLTSQQLRIPTQIKRLSVCLAVRDNLPPQGQWGVSAPLWLDLDPAAPLVANPEDAVALQERLEPLQQAQQALEQAQQQLQATTRPSATMPNADTAWQEARKNLNQAETALAQAQRPSLDPKTDPVNEARQQTQAAQEQLPPQRPDKPQEAAQRAQSARQAIEEARQDIAQAQQALQQEAQAKDLAQKLEALQRQAASTQPGADKTAPATAQQTRKDIQQLRKEHPELDAAMQQQQQNRRNEQAETLDRIAAQQETLRQQAKQAAQREQLAKNPETLARQQEALNKQIQAAQGKQAPTPGSEKDGDKTQQALPEALRKGEFKQAESRQQMTAEKLEQQAREQEGKSQQEAPAQARMKQAQREQESVDKAQDTLKQAKQAPNPGQSSNLTRQAADATERALRQQEQRPEAAKDATAMRQELRAARQALEQGATEEARKKLESMNQRMNQKAQQAQQAAQQTVQQAQQAREQAKDLRQLAQQQEALRELTQQAQQGAAGEEPKDQAQQQAQQQKTADALKQVAQKMSQSGANDPQTQELARRAAEAQQKSATEPTATQRLAQQEQARALTRELRQKLQPQNKGPQRDDPQLDQIARELTPGSGETKPGAEAGSEPGAESWDQRMRRAADWAKQRQQSMSPQMAQRPETPATPNNRQTTEAPSGTPGPIDLQTAPAALGMRPGDWAKLPDATRTQILQTAPQRLPAGYEEMVRAYYLRLAQMPATPGGN
jgi:hypothetical protein